LALIFVTLGCVSSVFAADSFRLAKLFTDNMVLQQGKEVPLWGFADDGAKVKVSFNGKNAEGVAQNGRWMVKLPAMSYGSGYTLKVQSGSNSIALKNVAIGEVWLCCGQSNMEWHLTRIKNGALEVKAANHPKLRLFQVYCKNSKKKRKNIKAATGWRECTPETAEKFSATGYFFGRELLKKNVHIGLIQCCIGGTAVEEWLSPEGFENNPFMKQSKYMQRYNHAVAKKSERVPRQPSGFYNGMLNPLIPVAFRGVIWYQGESNAGERENYEKIFSAMIKDWRAKWGEDFPFLFVQLAGFRGFYRKGDDLAFAGVREGQFKTLSLPNTGMATAADIGQYDNIHPLNKQDVGKRLALVAEHVAYGSKDVVYSGPVYKGMKISGNKIELSFDNVGSGLVVKGGELKGLEIAASDKQFKPAKAKVKNGKVIVWNDSVPAPKYVNHAFKNFPEITLYNKEGLPALPFRSETN